MEEKMKEVGQSQRIMDATIQCISTKGYANVSLRDIAEKADVVLSQLNYYYKNKEGLFVEVVKIQAQHYLCEIEECLKGGQSEKERITSIIDYFQGMLKKTPELYKLLFDLTSMAMWSEALKELINNFFNGVAELIEKYIISSYLGNENSKKYSSNTLAKMLLGTLFGTSILVMLNNGEKDSENALSAVEALF